MAFLLSYQWAGSARHLYWDMTAKGFNNATMLHSAYGLVAATVALSAGLALCSLPPLPSAKDKS